MSSPKFGPGDKVFAKMRGYPAWPSKVEGLADWTPGRRKYHIYFYGTKQIAVCREEELCSYVENKLTLGKPKKYKGFNQALSQMDSELGLSEENVSSSNQSHFDCDNIDYSDDNCNISHSSEPQPIVALPQFDFQACKIPLGTSTNSNIEELSENSDKLLSVLKIESQLLDLDYCIQTSLSIIKAEPDDCLNYLEKMLDLDIKPLMLKKHPEIVDTIMKLQMYVGNTKEWNMTEEEHQAFIIKANQIKIKAKAVFNKIQSLFNVPPDTNFLQYFNEEIKVFMNYAKNLTPEEVIRLIEDPTKTALPLGS